MKFTGIRDLVSWDADDILEWARALSGKEKGFPSWLSDLASIICSRWESDFAKYHSLVALFRMPNAVFSRQENLAATAEVVRSLVDLILKQPCDKDNYQLANQALVAVSSGFVDQPSLKA